MTRAFITGADRWAILKVSPMGEVPVTWKLHLRGTAVWHVQKPVWNNLFFLTNKTPTYLEKNQDICVTGLSIFWFPKTKKGEKGENTYWSWNQSCINLKVFDNLYKDITFFYFNTVLSEEQDKKYFKYLSASFFLHSQIHFEKMYRIWVELKWGKIHL